MLVVGSDMLELPVLSLHTGSEIARTQRDIIDPENLSICAYSLHGPLIEQKNAEVGNLLDTRDIREFSEDGFIIDSSDKLVMPDDVIKLKKILELNFDLVGLKVVTQKGKKLGKIVDYTFDSNTMMIYQIIVQRPPLESFLDAQLTINRSQIVEVDDYKLTVKHDKDQIKVPSPQELKEKAQEFVPNYVNPFRKGQTAESEESASKMSS